MRLLVENDFESILTGDDRCQVLHRYAHQVLLDCKNISTRLPLHSWQRIDDQPIYVNGVATQLQDGEFEYAGHPHTLLKFIGPIDTLWLQQLQTKDVRILFMCPPFGACVRLPELLRSNVLDQAFEFICASAPYLGIHCSRGLARERDKMQRGGLPEDACDLVFFSREDRVHISDKLSSQNIEILDSSNYKIRVRYKDSLSELREMHGVKLVDYSRPIQLCTDVDLNTAVARPIEAINGSELRGRGQVIAVADTGLDSGVNDASLHPDFQGRVKAIVSLPLNVSWRKFVIDGASNDGGADRNSGHGTHVAGLALGNGARSNGLHQGVAPEAELVFQAIEQYVDIKQEYRNEVQSGYYLSGRPLDLNELYKQAHEFGAHIHVNAWGDDVRGAYTDDCYETDNFLSDNPDAIILFAAGNSGADIDGNRILDMQSLYSPASAKNVVAVGATEGGIDDIGLRVNWGAFDTNNTRFRSSIDRADAISGESQRIALFSSTGPSKDGRIKPDVCAPGTNLVAPRSRVSPGKGWGLTSPLPFYMYNGGTSMSVGVAGGAAAVIREAWEKHNGQAPGGAALKALMILSTAPVLSRRDNKPEPLHVGGFGRIQIADALPQSQHHRITLIDEQDHGLTSGDMREFPVNMPQQGNFRAVLSWYDPPGETLINNLNLCLIEPSGDRIWGNHRPGERGRPDTVNNVQTIHFPALPTGKYLLRVNAVNIPQGPQGFGLAISLPPNMGLSLPLSYLLGIGTRYSLYLEQTGIQTIGQLALQPDSINEIQHISASVCQKLQARLATLAKVQQALSQVDVDAESFSINKLLNGKRPENVTEATWQQLREQCLPLILVFNKGALSRITLAMLRT